MNGKEKVGADASIFYIGKIILGIIPEMIEIAIGKHFRENKESKHWRNAMYGWYRYDSRFAIPVYRDDEEMERYNIFHASLIVRYSEDRKMHLYDVIDIKKETSNPIEP